ncbi:MAG TPA: hypothetical protein PLR06_14250 [Cyclobacteriaceae bacterium]|nr:hypothetical protein [Cyclobacteriaceae bacterium]
MKPKQFTWALFPVVYILLSFAACHSSEEEVLPRCMVSLLGDKDGFGMGLTNGQTLTLAGGTSLPLDHRSSTDPRFTDLYPADLAESQTTSHVVRYVHTFSPFSGNEVHAVLHLNTLGIQDGDSQVYGSSTDIKLFLDNEEVPDAFDSVDQFDFINNQWSDFAGFVDIEIPASLIHVLNDGKVEVRWELFQLVPNSNSYDAFAIDYSELEICRNK